MSNKSIYRADFFAKCPISYHIVDWISDHNSGNGLRDINSMIASILSAVHGNTLYGIILDDQEHPTEISVHYMGVLALTIRLHQVYDLAGIEDGIMTLKQAE